jgi:hypothetical protein
MRKLIQVGDTLDHHARNRGGLAGAEEPEAGWGAGEQDQHAEHFLHTQPFLKVHLDGYVHEGRGGDGSNDLGSRGSKSRENTCGRWAWSVCLLRRVGTLKNSPMVIPREPRFANPHSE